MSIDEKVRLLNGECDEKKSYSVEEVAKILETTRQSVYKLIKQNCFKAVKTNNGYRIVKQSFDMWLDNE